MWVPVATARRSVRSVLSPYTSPPAATPSHSSVIRSITDSSGSRATSAPLRAPTLVPSTRSGRTSRSSRARSMPTSTAPSTPPPPSTNAVVTRAPSRLRDRGGGVAGDQLGVLLLQLEGDPVLDPEDQQRHQPRGQHQQGEGQAP